MSRRGMAGGDLNERIALLLEPRPPKPEGEHAAELRESLLTAGLGVGKVPLSKGGGWTAVCVYEEGDEPRWVARDFSGDFELAMEAFRRLVPTGGGAGLALRYEPETGWYARLTSGTNEDDEEEGPGRSAAGALCRLLWSGHRRGSLPEGGEG